MKKYIQKDKVIIEDFDELQIYEEDFEKKRRNFDEKVHGSMTEEMKRNIKTVQKAKISANKEEVFKAFVELAAKDINSNLTSEDIVEDNFYITSKKMKKLPIKVSQYIKNEVIEIEWFAENHYFLRTVFFYGVNGKTKIKMVDNAKGMEAVFGVSSQYIKNMYVKSIKKSFKIQIIQIKLSIFDQTQINKLKLKKKLQKLQKNQKFRKK
ncbi:hypothetical protein [Mesoplasma florum]|uniref:hypothetical protein n=1 Tax=Mesoplasma florum TaxID=2151 RepID=UPI000D044E84|nr:hypothetical protein [Mesoplasma florum]AVN58901.1 hypothetical protein CG009_01510 [Mesoplasma florum]